MDPLASQYAIVLDESNRVGAFAVAKDGSLSPVSSTAAVAPRSGRLGLAAY